MSARKDLLNIVLGNPATLFKDDVDLEYAQKFLDVFKARGLTAIDTARAYGFGEKNFGRLKVASQGFILDTKVFSFPPGSHKAEKIHESVKQSLELLGVDKVHILYLHAPDRSVPLEETLKAIQEVYQQGKFEKFGISNYSAAEVVELLTIVDKHGYIRPTVYQGNYSLLVRKGEAELFPLLKKEKISFYAWSPLASGLLAKNFKTKEDFIAMSDRFNHDQVGPIVRGMFEKDAFFASLVGFNEFIKQYNLTNTETALRWLAHHSKLSKADGDAIVLGASKPEHFETSLEALERGPLPDQVVEYIDKLWEEVKDQSPPYHF